MVNLDFFLETQPQAWVEVLDLSLTKVDLKKIQLVKNSYGQVFELQPIVRFYYDFAFFGSPATYNCCYKIKPCQPADYPLIPTYRHLLCKNGKNFSRRRTIFELC